MQQKIKQQKTKMNRKCGLRMPMDLSLESAVRPWINYSNYPNINFKIIKGGSERNFPSQACSGIMLPHVGSSIKFSIDFEATEKKIKPAQNLLRDWDITGSTLCCPETTGAFNRSKPHYGFEIANGQSHPVLPLNIPIPVVLRSARWLIRKE